MEGMTGNRHAIVLDDVGVREVDGEELVAFSDLGTEKHGTLSLQLYFEKAEKAGPLVIQSLLTKPERLNVAVSIEDGKGITALQHPRAIIGP